MQDKQLLERGLHHERLLVLRAAGDGGERRGGRGRYGHIVSPAERERENGGAGVR